MISGGIEPATISAIIGGIGLATSLASTGYGLAQDPPEAAKPNLPGAEVGSLGAQAAPLKFGGPGGRMQTQQNRSNTALAMLG